MLALVEQLSAATRRAAARHAVIGAAALAENAESRYSVAPNPDFATQMLPFLPLHRLHLGGAAGMVTGDPIDFPVQYRLPKKFHVCPRPDRWIDLGVKSRLAVVIVSSNR